MAIIAEILLEQFSVLNEIFAEDNAFGVENYEKNMGRLYRIWKKTRTELDPDFDPKSHRWDWQNG